jgi:ClpP class serine protease
MTRAFNAVIRQVWAIEPSWLQVIADLAQRHYDAASVKALREEWLATQTQKADHLFMAARRAAQPLGNSDISYVRDGVAVIPIVGPIFPRANLLTFLSGATALSEVNRDYQVALESSNVRSILFAVDSPGGAASGINEFANIVFAARGTKKVMAYASGMAASAAYWIATAASEVVIDRTALVGSVGVIVGVPVQEAPDQNGMRRIYIVSANAPGKDPDPRTDAGVTQIRRMLNAVEGEFVAALARQRNVTTEKVLSDFGRGDVVVGEAALAAGMADRFGSFEDVIGQLAAASAPVGTSIAAAAAQPQETSMTTQMGAAEKDKAPPATQQSQPQQGQQPAPAATQQPNADTVRADATAAERQRIGAIVGSEQAKGREQLAAHLAFNTAMTSADAIKVLEASPKQAVAAAPAAPAGAKPPENLLAAAMVGVKNPDVGADGGKGGGNGDETQAAVNLILNAGKPKAA